MDKIKKALGKLSLKEKQKIKEILLRVDKGSFQGLNTKKLKGRIDIFRVRQGNIRIIFHRKNSSIRILTIERKGSKTYKKR